ncbi:hypothetical protein ACFVTX_03695 [Agromyces sp. NPDC058136]|uniref:hypothetical protein n=1 Tax=Agromyces sp. NPDC058136 TaxID=3346354 RepID=UPI0036DF1FF1
MVEQSETRFGWGSVVLIWAIAVVGSVIVGGLAVGGLEVWFRDASWLGVYGALGVVLAVAVLGTLVVQLATRRPEGFVGRVSASIAGAVVIVSLAALLLAPFAAR